MELIIDGMECMIKKRQKQKIIQRICFGGCNWDAMMLWMNENGIDVTKNEKTGIKDICPGTPTRSRNKSFPSIAGNTETDKLANIYDTLGGYREWGMEASETFFRDFRGGYYDYSRSPSNRGSSNSYYYFDYYRLQGHTLYVGLYSCGRE